METNNLNPKDIGKISYIDFVSLIKEENRPPGGKKTVREFLRNSFMGENSRILEVGCTNGFTSLEVARLLNCQVWGIDIHGPSVENAKSRVKTEKVKFCVADALNLPFESNFFDMVICSNATSFMEDKHKAILEYIKVLKPWGFIAISPMYYIKNPPKRIIKDLSKTINVKIEKKSKEDWFDLFKKLGLEVYYCNDYKFDKKTSKEIGEYVDLSLNKKYLKKLSKEDIEKIKKRWGKTIKLFNKNLGYVGYSVILLRKRVEEEEVELFTSNPIK